MTSNSAGKMASRVTAAGPTGQGSARLQHQFKIEPNRVRALEPGVAYVISRGRAMKVAVLRAPDLRGALPPINSRGGDHAVPVDIPLSDKEVRRLPF